MLIEIKKWVDGSLMHEIEADNLRAAVEMLAKSSANLYGADLRSADLRSADLRSADLYGANLRSANLYGANLRSADLRSANLRSANLYGADLYGANLRSANLYGADLRSADLRSADLRSADLRSANLYGANLDGADLRSANLSSANLRSANLYGADLRSANLDGADLYGADLRSANLRSAKNLSKFLTTPLYMLLDQPGLIRAYKLVTGKNTGPHYPGTIYQLGQKYEVVDANCNEQEQCAPGISLATLDWVMKEWRPGFKILIAEFWVTDIAAIPIGSDGKFRVFRCEIVGEKDLWELGLEGEEVRAEAEATA